MANRLIGAKLKALATEWRRRRIIKTHAVGAFPPCPHCAPEPDMEPLVGKPNGILRVQPYDAFRDGQNARVVRNSDVSVWVEHGATSLSALAHVDQSLAQFILHPTSDSATATSLRCVELFQLHIGPPSPV